MPTKKAAEERPDCARCGAPAEYRSASEAVNTVYYCQHCGDLVNEPREPLE